MYDKLEEVAARYDELTAMLSDPEILKDQTAFAKYSKEHAEKRPIVETFLKLKEVKQAVEDAHEILKGDDKELKELGTKHHFLLQTFLECIQDMPSLTGGNLKLLK